jgi:hypothetical protein
MKKFAAALSVMLLIGGVGIAGGCELSQQVLHDGEKRY